MNFTINLNLKNSTKIFRIDAILFSILLLASFLRIYHLGFQSAWLDEIHTLKEADPNLSLSEFHNIIMMREGIPHFYFLTIRFFAEIFGHSIYLARLVSAVAGIASVYYIFLIGKKLLDKRTGYIAALLLTVNLFHIEFSQEARSYSLVVFFILIATHRLLIYSKDVNYKNPVLLGFFTGLIPNAHPIGLLNVMAIFSFLLFLLVRIKGKDQKRHFFKNSFIVGVVFFIVFSPVYVIVSKVSDIQFSSVAFPTSHKSYTDPNVDYKRIGLFVGHELFINKLSIETQIGYYVYKPFNYEIDIYQRVGAKYYIYKNIFTGVSLKTHGGRAEAIEATLGIRL
jgi:4-amino-4-deoxy-L-arabinose transferase-like glycosyltransferase